MRIASLVALLATTFNFTEARSLGRFGHHATKTKPQQHQQWQNLQLRESDQIHVVSSGDLHELQ